MIIVLHEWEKFFYRILQKFTPTWYLQKFFGYDKAQIKREAKKNDSTDSTESGENDSMASESDSESSDTTDTDSSSEDGRKFRYYRIC